ncbi:MAG: 16S rRNA (cytosine(1402)-N(4))-methyltransferase RsmH [Nitrospinota bacterium]|nr:16S rRNA (cytosine(1402)-N(4))-methyltransferase RsmH [Nitrospinota bacterium]
MGGTVADFGHIPVLMDEVLSYIARPLTRSVLDATLGAGGHAEAILKAMDQVRLIGMDKDDVAIALSKSRLAPFGERVSFKRADFSRIGQVLDEYDFPTVDAILMDLGVSSMQIDNPSRGFSFSHPGPLDMRMDKSQKTTASDIVNSADEKELVRIFREYGEERNAPKVARAIVRERALSPIDSTDRLAGIVSKVSSSPPGRRRIHPATRVFQALRIAVNDEMSALHPALQTAVERLNPGGRIAVISFHSLEDRIVKRAFFDMAADCVCPKGLPVCVCGKVANVKIITKRPVAPSAAETASNPRARSARLRVAEKLAA